MIMMKMKKLAAVGAVCASFVVGGAISALAQDDHRDDKDKEVRQEERKDEKKEVRQEERHDEKHAEERRRIDDEHFRAHFGREHHFAINHVTVVEGHPHFAYGGYSFAIAQPWPVGWAYSDNVYVDYIDGEYYLFNVRHPGVRVAVTVLP
jgi:hypothetical protein